VIRLYIVLTKLNSERTKQTVLLRGSHRIQSVSHQQNVFTHTKQVSVTVMILFDKTLPISILTQLPPLKNMHTHIHSDTVASPKNIAIQYICFLFFIELLVYKSYNVIVTDRSHEVN